MTGKAAIAKILKLEGTEYLFCFPANSLIDACAAEGIRPILTRTERTLVNMADGFSRVSNGRRDGTTCLICFESGITDVAKVVSEFFINEEYQLASGVDIAP